MQCDPENEQFAVDESLVSCRKKAFKESERGA